MALRTIRVEGDPVLGKVCREVTEVNYRIFYAKKLCYSCFHYAIPFAPR